MLLAIVIDQLGAWVASERLPLLPANGGFARLLREGTYVREAHFAHAVTDTAPGHAALFSGAPPVESGIFGNEFIDEQTGKRVSILRDTNTRVVSPEGPIDRAGSSAASLRVDTIADRLRAAYSDARIVAISLKDRGAIFGGGRKPTASLWFDVPLDTFVTSTAFAPALPFWAAAVGGHSALVALRVAPWNPIDREWVSAHAATSDDARGEGDVEGLGTIFPHVVPSSRNPAMAFRATPFADEAIAALAVAALDAAPPASSATLLAVSFSSNDYVGHVFGPDSWEAWDNLRRLDATLAKLFDAMDSHFGRDGYAVILSADHGVATMPEAVQRVGAARACGEAASPDRWQRPCFADAAVGKAGRGGSPRGGEGGALRNIGPGSQSPGRLLSDDMSVALKSVAKAAFGHENYVTGVADPYVFVSREALALDRASRKHLTDVLKKALLAMPYVDRVYEMDKMRGGCPREEDESMDALVCRSAAAEPAAAFYVVPKAGSFFDPNFITGKGSSHGTPYLFDRAVPILVRAPKRATPGRVVEGPASYKSFAKTACSLLGIVPPAAATAGVDFSAP